MAILVRNTTPFRIAFLPGRISYPGHDVTVIVKGTFRLTHGDAADPVPPEEQLHLAGDLAFDDEREASLSYASDFAPFKPRADVLLVGTCHTPRGAPRDRALIGSGPVAWPDHAGRVGAAHDPQVQRALRALGSSRAAAHTKR